ncbi:hypothetical protein OAF30_03010 [Flavobacteriales bacterium]|nr:hypothetical protein [Flavobacteriales bacterium]
MELKAGATAEITSRWPEHKQRNVALNAFTYGEEYGRNMITGIEIVRDAYLHLKEAGETVWMIDQETADLLDSLVISS